MESVLSLKITLGFFFRKRTLVCQYHLWRGSLQPFFSRIINVAANFVLFWCNNSDSAPHPEPPPPVNLKLLPSSLLKVLLMSGTDRRVSPPVSSCRGDMLRGKQDSFFSIMSLAWHMCTRTSAAWRALKSFSEAEAFGVRQQRSACVALKDISVM